MATINSTNSNINFSVGPIGSGLYQTIQAGINAANAAGGGCVFIQPGSYTENLTLFGNVQLQGQTGSSDVTSNNSTVTITGVHTPPTSGYVSFDSLYLVSATHIFSSAAAGSTVLSLSNCFVNLTNGYIYNLTNWTGELLLVNVQDVSTASGVVTNTGGSPIVFELSSLGVGTGNSMVTSGSVTMDACLMSCPFNPQTGSNLNINFCTFSRTTTLSNNTTGSFSTCTFSTGATAAITMSSSAAISVLESIINSSNNPVIAGSGAGTLTLGGITFRTATNIAGTLTVSGAGGFLPAAFGTATQVLTSNGPGVIPTFQAAGGGGGGITTVAGDIGSATGSTVHVRARTATFTAGSTVTFTGSGANLDLQFTDLVGGGGNTCVGWQAGNVTNNINGDSCTGFGLQTLTSCTAGSSHTAIGTAAVSSVTAGLGHTGIGANCLIGQTGGDGNTGIGFNSGNAYTTTESYNIVINSPGVVGESNVLRIGAGTGTSTQQLNKAFISGIQGITVTGTAVLVSASDQLGVAISSAKYKDNIQDMADASSPALQLRPVTFSYKGSTETRFGLIAEEVAPLLPNLVVYDKQGDPQTVMYHELPALLLNELQKALKRIEALESKLGV